ncbi:hypothetical protein MKL01_08945 [Methylobacterium sp. J-070]|nr:hypothetical protein [Methylobacterium sp. J-070]MCJ2049815.1 hypothetical protein [Methylobacterium sp. J-070]
MILYIAYRCAELTVQVIEGLVPRDGAQDAQCVLTDSVAVTTLLPVLID